MTVYEKRTYSITVGQMSEVVRLYTDEGWPVLEGALWEVPWQMVTLMGMSQAGYLGPKFVKP